jgi:hypothetical protein
MEGNRIPKTVLYINLETRLRRRPRNRWKNEVREDGRIVGGERWQENVYNTEEWKKLLRTAQNHHNLHVNGKKSMNIHLHVHFNTPHFH